MPLNIKEIIQEIAKKEKRFTVQDILLKMDKKVSRQYIGRIIKNMVRDGVLVKNGSTKSAEYTLATHKNIIGDDVIVEKKTFKNINLGEDTIFQDIQHGQILKEIPENVSSILYYAFTEMMNNAIDHSQSKNIAIEFRRSHKNDITFIIRDYGIGVFNSIMKKKKLMSPFDAIGELLKGKVTTAPQAHSGEGIFFTSRIADMFFLESFSHQLRVDNTLPDTFIEELPKKIQGTKVTFQIHAASKKHLGDIFTKYQTDPDEYAFDKTDITVKLYTLGTIYISRSQAKRILQGLEKFKTVIMDFKNVPTVGQAFADEIFRVFHIQHPEVNITPIHMALPVEYMIKRAMNQRNDEPNE